MLHHMIGAAVRPHVQGDGISGMHKRVIEPIPVGRQSSVQFISEKHHFQIHEVVDADRIGLDVGGFHDRVKPAAMGVPSTTA